MTQAIEAIQKNQEMIQLKHELLKKAEEKRKEALVQQEGLIKSKQTLMEVTDCYSYCSYYSYYYYSYYYL